LLTPSLKHGSADGIAEPASAELLSHPNGVDAGHVAGPEEFATCGWLAINEANERGGAVFIEYRVWSKHARRVWRSLERVASDHGDIFQTSGFADKADLYVGWWPSNEVIERCQRHARHGGTGEDQTRRFRTLGYSPSHGLRSGYPERHIACGQPRRGFNQIGLVRFVENECLVEQRDRRPNRYGLDRAKDS
jgi:hypothetical protein